jgi:hypothetical protein
VTQLFIQQLTVQKPEFRPLSPNFHVVDAFWQQFRSFLQLLRLSQWKIVCRRCTRGSQGPLNTGGLALAPSAHSNRERG